MCVLPHEEVVAKYPEVARRLRKGLSVRDAAGACDVSPTTAYKVKKAISPGRIETRTYRSA